MTEVPGSAQPPQNDTAAAAGIAPFPPAPLEDVREAFTPNAPSSPQWTLGEHAREIEAAENESEPEAAADDAPPPAAVTPASEPAAASQIAARSAQDESRSEPENRDDVELPSEPRKGWWQRRFKM